MKLTEAKLKQLIKQQIVNESQKALGIPHGVDLKENPEVLYDAAMSFIMKNPDLGPYSPNHEDAKLLLRILTNTIQGAVTNREYGKGDMDLFHTGDVEGFIASKGGQTSPEETELMREAQGKLKMVKRALESMMGDVYVDNGYRAAQADKRDFFRNNPDHKPGDRVINEVRVAPDYSYFATDDQIAKIHSLLDSGSPESIEMAKSILDALGASPSYFENYMRYQEVGEVEKLANKHGPHGVVNYMPDDAKPDALEDYFTGLDNFEKRELGRGRTKPDPSKEFYNRYKGVADIYYDPAWADLFESADTWRKQYSGNLKEALMYEGDDSIMEVFRGATLDDGGLVCEACLFETLQEASCGCPDLMGEAVYQGKTVKLNKPTRGDVKKFKVYVNSGKKDKKGRIKAKKVNFGDKNMKIKKNNPKRRKSFRARHNCDNPGPKTKARYWSCKKW